MATQKYSDGDYQEAAQTMVRNEVIYCASSLIYELAQKEEYIDDLIDLCQTVDHEAPVDYYLSSVADSSEKADFLEYMNIDVPTMQLTIATDEHGERWNFQTGDNSYTGGAYGLPHWAVVEVAYDTEPEELASDVIDQLAELIDSSNLPCQKDVEDFITDSISDWVEVVEDLIEEAVNNWTVSDEADYQDAADYLNIDPEYNEVYEHWIVSDWLADRLEEKGEAVNKDFMGLTLWGRCTTGQAIAMDRVICDIYDDLHSEAA